MPSDHIAWAARDQLVARIEPLRADDHAVIARRLSRRAHGVVASQKNGRAVPWRNSVERDLFLLLEADPDVLSYDAMPERMHLLVEGRARTHVPSARVRVNGSDVVLDSLDTRHGACAALAGLVERAYRERGTAYRAVTPADIRLQPRFGNAKTVLASRRFRTRPGTELLVLRSLASHPVSTVDDVERDLAGEPDIPATVFRMALDGMLRLDLGATSPGAMSVRMVIVDAA